MLNRWDPTIPGGIQSQVKCNNKKIANHTLGGKLDEAGLEQKEGSKTIAQLVWSRQSRVRGYHFMTFKYWSAIENPTMKNFFGALSPLMPYWCSNHAKIRLEDQGHSQE